MASSSCTSRDVLPNRQLGAARLRLPAMFLSVLLAVLLWAVLPVGARAQEATPPVSPGELAFEEKEAQAIDGMLMCPVCPAETIDQAQVPLAKQMRQVVREKLAQGESREQILDYFASVYGQDVLAAPQKTGVNLIAWTVPVVAVLAALAAGLLVLRSMTARPAADTGGVAGEGPPPEDPSPYLEAADRELALSPMPATPSESEGESASREAENG